MATIFGVNIFTKYPKKADLINYLNDLHKTLSLLSQEIVDRPKGLKQTALQLVLPKLLNHTDKDVRVLCTCCIVDVLRVFAPEAPYSNEDTISAFKAIATQLRGLATYDSVSSILTSKAYYILNSISTVQSCVVPVILVQSGVFGADDVVLDIFEALISSVRPEHPEELLTHAAAVLQFCIEESEGISEDLLDVLLLPLLPHNKSDHPTAYQLAGTVLRRVAATIQTPVSAILNQILVGTSRDSLGCSSEITEHIYPLIYELHKISSTLLIRVIPNICLQLQVEEEEIRLKAVKLLGSLFASNHAEYGKEFGRNFKEYLGRCADLSAEIRLEVVNNCSLIIQNHAALRCAVEEPLRGRLRDSDEHIRLAALSKLVDLAYAQPTCLSVATYIEMSERAKDKRHEVKRLAMVGLAKIYGRHISTVLPPLSGAGTSLRTAVDPEVLSRLEFVPGLLLKCWSYPEMGSKHLILQLIQEQLLPKAFAAAATSDDSSDAASSSPSSSGDKKEEQSELNERRASALLLIYEGLPSGDRNSLASILGFKSKARVELQDFLKIRSAPTRSRNSTGSASSTSRSKSSGGGSQDTTTESGAELSAEEQMKAMRKSMLRLMQVVPSSDKKSTFIERLFSTKDRTVYRLLDHCVSPRDSISQSLQHREDLKQRLDSKSTLGEYIGTVYDVAGYLAVNAAMVRCLLERLEQVSVAPEAFTCSELLVLLAKHSPQAFQGSVSGISTWLSTCVTFESGKSKQRDVQMLLLEQCLAMITTTCAAFEADPAQPALCSEIAEHIKKNTQVYICAKLAELCAQVAYFSPAETKKHAGQESVTITKNLLNVLCSSKTLNLSNKRLESDLSALAALCVVPKAAYTAINFLKPSFLAVMETVTAKTNQVADFVKNVLFKAETGAVSARTMAAGLKALTSVLGTQEELRQLQKSPASDNGVATHGSAATSSSHSSKDLQALATLLFECIGSAGGELGTFTAESEDEKELLFETAASCAFSLMKIKVFAARLTVDQWHTLGWTLLHGNPAIRQRLFQHVSTSIQMHPLHPKFLAYPCLFAMDEKLGAHAEQALGFAVQRLRRTHEELCSQAIAQSGDAIKADHLRRLAESWMPETILPYLLHLLSYHPEFPTSITVESEGDKRRMKNLVRSVRMLLQVLQSSLINDSCNMSYLFKQLNTINQYYLDRHDPANSGLHFVTRMTVKLLNEQIKTSDNVQMHPGEITLPAELFERKSGREEEIGEGSAAMAMLGAGTAEGLEEAEQAIDKVLQVAGKGTKVSKAALMKQATIARALREAGEPGSASKNRKRLSESPAEDGKRKSTDRARTSVGSSEKPAPAVTRLPEEAPTRTLPKRSAKEVVSYREPVENDREMNQWEADAAQVKRPRRSSELSLPRSSFSSELAEGLRLSSSPAKMRESASPRGRMSNGAPSHPSQPVLASQLAPAAARSSLGKTTQDDDSMFQPLSQLAPAPAPAPARTNKKSIENPAEEASPVKPAGKSVKGAKETSKDRVLQPKTNAVEEAPPAKGKTGKTKAQEVIPTEPAVPAKTTRGTKAVPQPTAEKDAAAGPTRRSARPIRA